MEYRFQIWKRLFGQVGLGSRYIYASGKIDGISFRSTTIRLQMPLKFNYPLSERWIIGIGTSIQNNKDLLKSDFREPYFWRANLILEGTYFWLDRWYCKGSLFYEGRNVPDAYLINDPKIGILFGLGWRIWKKKSQTPNIR